MRHVVWPSLVLPLILAGCSIFELTRISTPRDLSAIEPLPVKQRILPFGNPPLSFGSWQTREFHRDFEFRVCDITVDSTGTDKVKSTGRFRFTMTAPQAPEVELHAECNATSRATLYKFSSANQLDSDGYPRLHCEFSGFDSGGLDIERRGGRFETGTAVFQDHDWEIRPVIRDARGSLAQDGPYGYEIVDEGGSVIAAVELPNGGRVWLKSIDSQNDTRLATLAAALLLYRPAVLNPDKDCNRAY